MAVEHIDSWHLISQGDNTGNVYQEASDRCRWWGVALIILFMNWVFSFWPDRFENEHWRVALERIWWLWEWSNLSWSDFTLIRWNCGNDNRVVFLHPFSIRRWTGSLLWAAWTSTLMLFNPLFNQFQPLPRRISSWILGRSTFPSTANMVNVGASPPIINFLLTMGPSYSMALKAIGKHLKWSLDWATALTLSRSNPSPWALLMDNAKRW